MKISEMWRIIETHGTKGVVYNSKIIFVVVSFYILTLYKLGVVNFEDLDCVED